MSLTEFLGEAGYRRIALSRSSLGHFHVRGTLDEHPVSILLDTGAASTVMNVSAAETLGLPMTKMPFQGWGAGAARMDVFQVQGGLLRIAGIDARPRAVMAMSLAHVNEALALKGEHPVDIIVGADVFEAQEAVIDYASHSLFLKP